MIDCIITINLLVNNKMDIGSTNESENLSILNDSNNYNIKKFEKKDEEECASDDLHNISHFSD